MNIVSDMHKNVSKCIYQTMLYTNMTNKYNI